MARCLILMISLVVGVPEGPRSPLPITYPDDKDYQRNWLTTFPWYVIDDVS